MKGLPATIVFAGYEVQDLLIVFAVTGTFLTLVAIMIKTLKKNDPAPYVQHAVCRSCAMQGIPQDATSR